MSQLPAAVVAFLLICGCAGGEEDDKCIFDGRYEMGFIPRNGCEAGNESFTAAHEEDECHTSVDQISLGGARQLGFISCEPGDPVVECSGFLNDSDGCSWDLYIRRIAQ